MLRFLAALALVPYALRGVGAILIMLLVGIAAVSAYFCGYWHANNLMM